MLSKQQRDLICQLYAHYVESHYPTSFSCSFLHLSPVATKQQPQRPRPPAPEQPVKTPQPSPSIPTSTPTHKVSFTPAFTPKVEPRKSRLSSWYYVRPLLIHSHEELSKQTYKTLAPHIIKKENAIHPCCTLFVFHHEDEEFYFFHRLAKIISQRLFPARMDVLQDPATTMPPHTSPLCLVPLKFLHTRHPSARLHQPMVIQNTTWLPTSSSQHYEQDPKIKQQLWNLLKQQPFAYTQKS